ncbi:hypothetical protein NKR19_g3519 [Coniochaeta hoffmannii]|uniref:BZIP domain-containing protein n=1 Tax=Coniochaeta hoffmannii TaxID=91930 RepID=A0AA38SGL9_9PEZI|nr:hypothetical protein NKR19_g3519 [Coniochaeta hoffmannii]
MVPTTSSESDGLKHKKRVITPARKEQNRKSQQLYRERQKNRRRGRQPVLATKPLELRPGPAPHRAADHNGQLEGQSLPNQDIQGLGVDLCQLPDPWRNSIQFTTTTVLNAFLNIALSLGFNLSDLTGSNCLGSSIQSPFYRPTTPGDNPQALLAAARRPSFPANLQPTLSQILIPHHPFLDLIPFPALRDRAIILAAAVPHLFSMAELKNDVYVHGALVCWVGGPGAQPWDVHSWEAAPWFLRKWRLVVGSEDGELSRTSKWWQDARGA